MGDRVWKDGGAVTFNFGPCSAHHVGNCPPPPSPPAPMSHRTEHVLISSRRKSQRKRFPRGEAPPEAPGVAGGGRGAESLVRVRGWFWGFSGPERSTFPRRRWNSLGFWCAVSIRGVPFGFKPGKLCLVCRYMYRYVYIYIHKYVSKHFLAWTTPKKHPLALADPD